MLGRLCRRTVRVEVIRPTLTVCASSYGAGRPPGDVGGQLLEQCQRALPAPVPDRVCQVAPGREDPVQRPVPRPHRAGLARLVQRLVADQVAKVGQYPVLAGLDEPVVVQAADVVLDHADLLRDHLQQRAQWLALGAVPQTVDDGQQLVEPIRRVGRHRSPLLQDQRVWQQR